MNEKTITISVIDDPLGEGLWYNIFIPNKIIEKVVLEDKISTFESFMPFGGQNILRPGWEIFEFLSNLCKKLNI